jgi:hypothetical protein
MTYTDKIIKFAQQINKKQLYTNIKKAILDINSIIAADLSTHQETGEDGALQLTN